MAVWESVRGFFAVVQSAVKKNVSFVWVRLGQIRLVELGFFYTANCPTAKNPRAMGRKAHPSVCTQICIVWLHQMQVGQLRKPKIK